MVKVKGKDYFQKVSFTRVPIRLGEDVFENGKISETKQKQLSRTMKAFWYLMGVQNVVDFRACATSAMREAKNKDVVLRSIKKNANVDIEIITGSEEADLIFGNFKHHNIDPSKKYLYIDVGGGSTEFSVISDGKRVKAKSFKIGTVRALKGKVKDSIWKEMEDWISECFSDSDDKMAIGTGGNINRIYKISSCKRNDPLSYQELKSIYNELSDISVEDRISKMRLKPDRADVITHAGLIYKRAMQYAKIDQILVPRVGLRDGIVIDLYKKSLKEKSPSKK